MTEGRPGLEQLCRLLLKHAAFTVGGGSVTTVALERDAVDRLHWMSRERYRTIYGLARLTPGTSILALATGLGWHFHRWRGALLALLCASVPGSILAALLAGGYARVYQNPTARAFLMGAVAAVCGFIAASIWRLLGPYLERGRRRESLIVLAIAFAISLWGVSPFPVIAGLAVIGFLLPERQL